jgi:hypothetical protein
VVLHKLRIAREFEGREEALRDEISRLQRELEEARAELQAEQRAAQEERARLSNALTELELHTLVSRANINTWNSLLR